MLAALRSCTPFCGLFRETKVSIESSWFNDSMQLRFELPTLDREQSIPMTLYSAVSVPLETMRADHLLDTVHQAFRGLVMHEADESFMFDGVRPFDPHANDDKHLRLARGDTVDFAK